MSAALDESALSAPATLPGFEAIYRYWDAKRQTHAAKIRPGEYYVTCSDEMISTVLGSCVSACIRDRKFGIGGMNHFMLPLPAANVPTAWESTGANAATRYGNVAMEHLINEILKQGGRRKDLEVKLFGGARILEGLSDIGRQNIAFVREYLHTEGFTVAGEDLSDVYPRKVVYYPRTGRALVKKLPSLHCEKVARRETQYMHELENQPIEGEIDLF